MGCRGVFGAVYRVQAYTGKAYAPPWNMGICVPLNQTGDYLGWVICQINNHHIQWDLIAGFTVQHYVALQWNSPALEDRGSNSRILVVRPRSRHTPFRNGGSAAPMSPQR